MTNGASGPAVEAWERRFAVDGYVFGDRPNAWLMRQASHWQPGQRALCVADGEGRNGVALAACGLQVDSFEPSPSAVNKARSLALRQWQQLQAICAGWEDFAWQPASYELVVGVFIQFAGPDERQRLFARMQQALRPGGKLLLLGYTPAQLQYRTGGPSAPEQLYTEALLRQAFQGLQIIVLECFEEYLEEGNGHRGRSALIGLVAQAPP